MSATPIERTVLLVENEAEAREVIAEHLALHGFTVLEATNGVEGWRTLERSRPDAVVMNLNVPRLGGLEMLRRIRAFAPSLAVVALAEAADTDVHWRALELGAREALPTPVVLADLLEALETGDALPATPADLAPVATPATTAPPPAPRVLIVTDDADARATLGSFLGAKGYQASAAADDTTAVDAIVEAPPSVVLLDISTAGLDAIEAVSTIRTLAPHAFVLMVGENSDAEIGRRGLARGVFDFLTKPVDLAELGESLAAALTMRRLIG